MCSSAAWLVEKGFYIIFLPGFTAFYLFFTLEVSISTPFSFVCHCTGVCWVLQIHSNACEYMWILPSFLISVKLCEIRFCTTLCEICYAVNAEGGFIWWANMTKIYKYCQRVGLPHPLCIHTLTHTHAYKMFNINICKFLEQRRRIKTHA